MKVKSIVGISKEEFDKLPETEKGKYLEEVEVEPIRIDCTVEEYVKQNGLISLEELEDRLNKLLDNVTMRKEED